ncbi:MAG: hypothetical protein LBH29_01055 [Elusimicrobiota bacterium]|nr:hypothetical protein [Elusimicrobiota bacterium]
MKKALPFLLIVLVWQAVEAKILTRDNVSIETPQEWSDNISNNPSPLIMSVYIGDDENDFKENAVITKEKLPQTMSVSEYKAASLDGLKLIFSSLSVIESKDNYMLISHKLQNGAAISQMIYTYIKDGFAYNLIFSAASQNYKKSAAVFNKMAKSLKIK